VCYVFGETISYDPFARPTLFKSCATQTFSWSVDMSQMYQKQTNSPQFNFRSAAINAYSRSPAAFRAA
jgi:hypothetical protein